MTNQAFRPRRSALYMPGSNARALEKARTIDTDCLILDLEDAVAPDQKDLAREQVAEAVAARAFGFREVIVRLNGFDTAWGDADLAAIAPSGPDAILVPKVSDASAVGTATRRIRAAGAPPGTALWVMMETPLAVLNAAEIAAASTEPDCPLSCFVLGTNDLAKDTRAALVPGRAPMLAWLQTCLAAARAYGLDILDGVYNAIGDPEGFALECRQGVELGMDGKTLIHPKQIGPCNAAFSPDPQEVDWAQRVIETFEQPENAGKGALQIDGRMVERLHADIARRTLAIAEAIRDRAA
ncbi:MAG: CoA ester lyase [Pseudomonadota bacterium]